MTSPDPSPTPSRDPAVARPGGCEHRVAIVRSPIAVDELVAWATRPSAGAVVTFLGVVLDHAEGRDGVRAMTYEAYEEPAREALARVATEAARRWPDLIRIAIEHRVGRLELSDASVAVVVSSPHRAASFAGAGFCIDTLKETVPVWKQEHWEGGSDWAHGAVPIRRVAPAPSG